MQIKFTFPLPPDSARMALYRHLFRRPGHKTKSWNITLGDQPATDEEIAAACMEAIRQYEAGECVVHVNHCPAPRIRPICARELVALIEGGMGWGEAVEKLRVEPSDAR